MSQGGGTAARSGFEYQDLAAATYFIKDTNALKLDVEPDYADFSFKSEQEDITVEHYYEVKKRSSDHFTWSDYKNAISDNFSKLAKEKAEEDVKVRLGLITNCTFNQNLDSFLSDLEKVKKREMMVDSFRTKHQRTRINALEESTGLSGAEFEQLLDGIYAETHTKRELKLELKDFLRDCHPTRHTEARRKIRDIIGRVSGGSITQKEIRQEVGFPLEPRNMDSATNDDIQIQSVTDDLESIVENQENQKEDIKREEPLKYEGTAEMFAEQAKSVPRINSENASKRASKFKKGAEKLSKAQRLEREGRDEIEHWGRVMVEMTDRGGEDD